MKQEITNFYDRCLGLCTTYESPYSATPPLSLSYLTLPYDKKLFCDTPHEPLPILRPYERLLALSPL
jgi:hypothetical protein